MLELFIPSDLYIFCKIYKFLVQIPLLFDIDLSVAFEGADDDLVGVVGQMRKLYKINEGMFNIDFNNSVKIL